MSFIFSHSFSQSVGDYQSLTSGNWTATTTWQQCFVAGSWAAATSAPTAASGVITILAGHTVTINAALSNSASIVIAATGKLQTAAGITLTNNAAGTITNNGTLINSSTLTTGVIINNGAILNNLTLTNNGTLTHNLTLNNATGATITHSGVAGAAGFTNASTGTITNI
ncbi:MAG: hypothetical protein ACXVDW_04365 [Bacteroidia bacterium]